MVFMTPIVIANLCKRPSTRLYPLEKRDPFAGSRGRLANNPEVCILCGICAKVCPSQCITVRRKDELWEYDPYACVFCGVCAAACPSGSLCQREERLPVVAVMEKVVVTVHVEGHTDTEKSSPR